MSKYGQIASGMNNTFSTIWIEQLRKLEDKVPPRPKEVVMRCDPRGDEAGVGDLLGV